jgi:hypothetical protein
VKLAVSGVALLSVCAVILGVLAAARWHRNPKVAARLLAITYAVVLPTWIGIAALLMRVILGVKGQ